MIASALRQLKPIMFFFICSLPLLADYTIENTVSSGGLQPALSGTLAQSFTTTSVANGSIQGVELEFGTTNLCDGLELRIYEGNHNPDTPSVALYSETFTGFSTVGWVPLPLSQMVPIQAGTQYTIEFKSTVAEPMNVQNSFATNPYSGGHCWMTGAARLTDDLAFRVQISAPLPGVGYTIQQTSSNGATRNYYHGQSFTTTEAGTLTQVDISVHDINGCSDVQLRIYLGNRSPGNPSQALYVEDFSGLAGGLYAMPLSNPLRVNANEQYTWELYVVGNCTPWMNTRWDDVYAGGHAWIGRLANTGADYVFHVHIDPVPTVRICYLDTDETQLCESETLLDQGATAFVDDSDGSGYDGGELLVVIIGTPDPSEDKLSVDNFGDVFLAGTTAGSQVSVSGTVIGTLGTDIIPGNDLLINFNSSATDALISTLVQALTYENVALMNRSPEVRTLRVTVSDAGGDTSYGVDVTVDVHLILTASISSDHAICEGDNTSLQVELTGTPPWDVTLSDGTVYTGVQASPLIHDISPTVTTVYSVTSVVDSHCENIGSGQVTVVVNPIPSASMSGNAVICNGDTTLIQMDLAGTPPWMVFLSDGTVYSGVVESPLFHEVSPDETTVYTVNYFEDQYCAGNVTGIVTVTVNNLGVLTNPVSSIAQGLAFQEFEAFSECVSPPSEFEWTIPATGFSYGLNVNPITIDPIPQHTTDYQIRVTDELTRESTVQMTCLLVAENTVYFDINRDGFNNIVDVWFMCPSWRADIPLNEDPDGTGTMDILDFLYINLDDPLSCSIK